MLKDLEGRPISPNEIQAILWFRDHPEKDSNPELTKKQVVDLERQWKDGEE